MPQQGVARERGLEGRLALLLRLVLQAQGGLDERLWDQETCVAAGYFPVRALVVLLRGLASRNENTSLCVLSSLVRIN